MAADTTFGKEFFSSKNLINIQYDLSHNFVEGEGAPPLERIVLYRIALFLWHQSFTSQSRLLDLKKFLIPEEITLNAFLPVFWHQQTLEIAKKVSHFLLPQKIEMILQGVVVSLGRNIMSFLVSLVKLKGSFTCEKLNIYLNSIYLTRHGTIDYVHTVSYLVKNPNLGKEERFRLACNCCLKEQIELFRKNCRRDYLFSTNRNLSLPMFWSKPRKGKGAERAYRFYFVNKSKIYDVVRLLKWAIRCGNEVAVHYIWENLNNWKMKEQVTQFAKIAVDAFSKTGSSNIICYMLSKLDKTLHIEDVFVQKGFGILIALERNCRWKDYLYATAECILIFILKMDFEKAWQTLKICWKLKILDWDQCMKILHDRAVAHNIDMHFNYVSSSKAIFPLLLNVEEKKTITSLLNIGSVKDGKKFLYQDGVGMCLYLIKKDKLDAISMFLKEMLPNKDLEDYKNYFFEHSGFQSYLDLSEDINYLDKFLHMFNEASKLCNPVCCDIKSCIRSFKKKLPYKREGIIVCDIFSMDISSVLKENMVDKFLKWCFDNNEMEIINCKELLFGFQIISHKKCERAFLMHVYGIAKKGDWNTLDQCLTWAFSSHHNNILKFRKNYISKLESELGENCMFDILRDLDLSNFKLFLEYFNIEYSQELKEKIKIKIFGASNYQIIGRTLNNYKYSNASEILDWIFCSHKYEIEKYKNLFMRSDGAELFYKMVKERSHKHLVSLIKWYSPYYSKALSYKEWFLNCFMPRKFDECSGRLLGVRSWRHFKRRVKLYLSLVISFSQKQKEPPVYIKIVTGNYSVNQLMNLEFQKRVRESDQFSGNYSVNQLMNLEFQKRVRESDQFTSNYSVNQLMNLKFSKRVRESDQCSESTLNKRRRIGDTLS